eukprot:TRINITY_DN15245_c0_g1_i1.p1 TRINITY_DN15245_c0_g1~~TRINITY_DN15245_c0_g1_i1.p1  ORF type:complete len:101 (-),score=6.22 TRINITY_DN15245_c0_g1_i1:51-353(-)
MRVSSAEKSVSSLNVCPPQLCSVWFRTTSSYTSSWPLAGSLDTPRLLKSLGRFRKKKHIDIGVLVPLALRVASYFKTEEGRVRSLAASYIIPSLLRIFEI